MKTKHTPTPWTIEGYCIGHRTSKVAGSSKGLVAILGQDVEMSGDEIQANAAFIVQACNHHAELVVALSKAELALRWAAQESAGRVKAEIVGGWLYHADHAKSLLAKVKGQP